MRTRVGTAYCKPVYLLQCTAHNSGRKGGQQAPPQPQLQERPQLKPRRAVGPAAATAGPAAAPGPAAAAVVGIGIGCRRHPAEAAVAARGGQAARGHDEGREPVLRRSGGPGYCDRLRIRYSCTQYHIQF